MIGRASRDANKIVSDLVVAKRTSRPVSTPIEHLILELFNEGLLLPLKGAFSAGGFQSRKHFPCAKMSAAPLSVMQSADDVRQGLTWTQRVTQHMECLLNRGECASSHLSRKKTRREFVRLSGAVAGIEFCYSAETAYVSPILMSLGIPVSLATTVWCLSPMLGFFLSPLFGSLSDCCTSPLGRRRPFILLLSAGICLGLLLLPNAHLLGAFITSDEHHVHVWTIVLTILGTLLLDFCCDACQSPSRTYLLDVTQPEEHSLGLSTFTVMAGLGGSLGYFIGFVPWENIGALSWLLQDQVRTVFTLVGIIFVVCVAATVTSFPEVPLKVRPNDAANVAARHYCELADEEAVEMQDVKCMGNASASGGGEQSGRDEARDEPLGFREYVKSIILMPEAFRILCVTNLFSWMSLVCYSLYFTGMARAAREPLSRIACLLQ